MYSNQNIQSCWAHFISFLKRLFFHTPSIAPTVASFSATLDSIQNYYCVFLFVIYATCFHCFTFPYYYNKPPPPPSSDKMIHMRLLHLNNVNCLCLQIHHLALIFVIHQLVKLFSKSLSRFWVAFWVFFRAPPSNSSTPLEGRPDHRTVRLSVLEANSLELRAIVTRFRVVSHFAPSFGALRVPKKNESVRSQQKSFYTTPLTKKWL